MDLEFLLKISAVLGYPELKKMFFRNCLYVCLYDLSQLFFALTTKTIFTKFAPNLYFDFEWQEMANGKNMEKRNYFGNQPRFFNINPFRSNTPKNLFLIQKMAQTVFS